MLREGRMTPAQSRALEELWPIYGMHYSKGLIDIAGVFRDSSGATDSSAGITVMDIGFGMGDALFESMLQNPRNRYIGVEVHGPGVGHLMSLAAGASLTNLRIYRHDVIEVLTDCIPDESLDKVQIFFPDPWPKKRHQKRRLIQHDFIELLVRKLKPGGMIHLATDWPSYAEQMREVISNSPGVTEISGEIDRPVTKYERRAQRLGHDIFDLACTRISK